MTTKTLMKCAIEVFGGSVNYSNKFFIADVAASKFDPHESDESGLKVREDSIADRLHAKGEEMPSFKSMEQRYARAEAQRIAKDDKERQNTGSDTEQERHERELVAVRGVSR